MLKANPLRMPWTRVLRNQRAKAEPGPYTQYLKPGALKGKRFGVPAFILEGTGMPFQGIAAVVPDVQAEAEERRTGNAAPTCRRARPS